MENSGLRVLRRSRSVAYANIWCLYNNLPPDLSLIARGGDVFSLF